MLNLLSPIQYIFIVTIVLYILDSIWEVGSLFRPGAFSKRLSNYFILTGLSFHCAFLIVVSIRSGTLPVSTLFESSTFYLSLIVLLSVILKFLYRLQALTPFVMPIVTGFSIASIALVRNDLALTYNLKTFWLCPHNPIIPRLCLFYRVFYIQYNVPDTGEAIKEKVLWPSF